MATSILTQFESGHTDTVHDAVFDYYGRRLATASSDRGIKVFDVQGDQVTLVADLLGHEGPVWEVSWAHPRYGSLLASASFDGRVLLWREGPDGTWHRAGEVTAHSASVNAVAWAPEEAGLALAAASSDGSVSVTTAAADGSWTTELIEGAHPAGALSVTWAPASAPIDPGSAQPSGEPVAAPWATLATGGADGAVRLWRSDGPGAGWTPGPALPAPGHSGWVRDVAWAPGYGAAPAVLASAGQDGRVLAWSLEAGPRGEWHRALVVELDAPVWRLSWSTSGGILAVSDGNDALSLWKQAPDGSFLRVEE